VTGEARMVRSHEDLDVWKLAMDLADAVYEYCKSLPTDERFGLVSQLQRAAVSVAANIAEGAARESTKEFIRHRSIAQGSLAEVQTLILIARRRKFGTDAENERIGDQSKSVARMLVALRKVLRRNLEGNDASR
jgi:four helix bundle protein